ncbi:hypothetical protein VTI74DRAFT_3034 [Chaetomium olivicolor]
MTKSVNPALLPDAAIYPTNQPLLYRHARLLPLPSLFPNRPALHAGLFYTTTSNDKNTVLHAIRRGAPLLPPPDDRLRRPRAFSTTSIMRASAPSTSPHSTTSPTSFCTSCKTTTSTPTNVYLPNPQQPTPTRNPCRRQHPPSKGTRRRTWPRAATVRKPLLSSSACLGQTAAICATAGGNRRLMSLSVSRRGGMLRILIKLGCLFRCRKWCVLMWRSRRSTMVVNQ